MVDKTELKKLYSELKEQRRMDEMSDFAENYTNGYKIGNLNGKIELLEYILEIDIGESREEKARG